MYYNIIGEKMNYLKKKAFTLIEILLTLTFVVLISILSIYLYVNVSKSSKQNFVIDQIVYINSITDSASKSLKITDYNDYIMSDLEKNKYSYINKEGSIIDSYGSPVLISDKKDTNGLEYFNLTYSNIKPSDCINIISKAKPFYTVVSDNSGKMAKTNSKQSVINFCESSSSITFSSLYYNRIIYPANKKEEQEILDNQIKDLLKDVSFDYNININKKDDKFSNAYNQAFFKNSDGTYTVIGGLNFDNLRSLATKLVSAKSIEEAKNIIGNIKKIGRSSNTYSSNNGFVVSHLAITKNLDYDAFVKEKRVSTNEDSYY